MIHTTPVNPNATPEATALLQYLHDIAGTNILAGQHTQTNPMEEVAYIETVTGKSPKLCGFELLAYSPNIRWKMPRKPVELRWKKTATPWTLHSAGQTKQAALSR